MTEDTSRPNKLWLAISWRHAYGWHIEWRWKADPFRSRLMFQFGPDEPFQPAKSFDEDVVPRLKSGKEV